MTAPDGQAELEAQFDQWRQYVLRRRELQPVDADELEDHLRGSVDELVDGGLRPDEAFLVAVKRMGSLDELSREFAREHSERLWKQLVLTGDTGSPAADTRARRDLRAMVVCAAGAVVSVKLPALFGLSLADDGPFYARNFALFVLPWLAGFLAWRRQARRSTIAILAAFFALGAVAANAYPLADDSQSVVVTSIHLPIALWLVTGLAYVAAEWRSSRRRMDFIRFTGEWFIYYVLMALGGGVLSAFLYNTFQAIGIFPEEFVSFWLLPCGAAAAVVVAGWLVEAKQSVVENIAPVLTRLFTPLFTAALVAFLVAVFWTSHGIDVDRETLILFNLLLVVVLGLLLYSLSARDPLAAPGLFDKLQLALVVSALAIDVLVLLEITGRITDEYGSTPNRTAALGENVILLINLAWSAWLLLAFLRRRAPFAALERWQTGYLPVYAAWAWIVVLVFPPLFNYI
ncbi:permease prefix domain 1-containing protein [Actinoplanes sp. KI2]|uniref:permease prefix domain 1-containing protein n=1 Tax=Actinoplanes sp. KI2 TaxID=2983315 RepID=UPI0021D5FF52|nr:permease prefix domain 1-containing protein [Actinoplanes sp. KI2]MCU7729343.1 permease prefix domain 1-containing protein [Actinoplanes sp. KI2]